METDLFKNDESQILDVTRKLTKLMIGKDTSGLELILDPAFTLTHITGYLQPKREWLSEITSDRMKYFSYQEVKTAVEIKWG